MKDYLAAQVRLCASPVQGRNVAREYLQARILGSLQRVGAMVPLAFHGGTLLRFLYSIPRYSEDLDFAVERPSSRYDFRRYLQAVRADLAAEGYVVSTMIPRLCWPASCTPSCSGPTPRAETRTTCCGTSEIPIGPPRI